MLIIIYRFIDKLFTMKIITTFIAILFSVSLLAQPGSWKQIGTSGGWANTKKMTMINDMIYSVDNSGTLYETMAATGAWKKLGSAYSNTSFMFAGNTFLYTIETSGSLYIINRTDGSWKRMGNAGAWIGTIAGTVLNGNLYTAEKNGALYVTDLGSGNWKQIGKTDFAQTWKMWAANNKLYSIEKSGTMYEISPVDGSWKQVGLSGAWNNTIAGVVLNNLFYSVSQNGALYVTDPATGAWKQLGSNAFGATVFMGAGTSKLYTIESSGTLYEVNVK